MKLLSLTVDRILPAFAAITGVAVASDGASNDSIAIWALRGFITACIAIIAYFLKKMVDESRQADIVRDQKIENLIKVTSAHEVMYEVWLETISNSEAHPIDGLRKTDQLHRIIQRIADSKGV